MKLSDRTKREMEDGRRALRRFAFNGEMATRYGEHAVTVSKVGNLAHVRLNTIKDFAVLEEPDDEFPSEELLVKIALVMG